MKGRFTSVVLRWVKITYISGGHLVLTPAQKMAKLKVRGGCPGLRLIMFWKSLRMENPNIISVLLAHRCTTPKSWLISSQDSYWPISPVCRGPSEWQSCPPAYYCPPHLVISTKLCPVTQVMVRMLKGIRSSTEELCSSLSATYSRWLIFSDLSMPCLTPTQKVLAHLMCLIIEWLKSLSAPAFLYKQ